MTDRKVVVVTGANSGIGFHMTRALLLAGYRVAALDLNLSDLTPLTRVHPESLLPARCDVTNDEEVAQAISAVLARWGGVDILVNNACLALFRPFAEREAAETRREFEVNYFGSLRMISAVLPSMRERGRGIIHNVSSGVGFTGFPGMTGYTSTKGAIEALTRTLNLELQGSGVTVNVMHPPLTRTKSSEPMGVPPQAMADPKQVGERLAEQIESVRPFVTADLATGIGMVFMRWFPVAFGRLLTRLTARAAKAAQG